MTQYKSVTDADHELYQWRTPATSEAVLDDNGPWDQWNEGHEVANPDQQTDFQQMNSIGRSNSVKAQQKRKRRNWIVIIASLLVVVAVGVGLGVGLKLRKTNAASSTGGGAGSGAGGPAGSPGSTPSSGTSGKTGSFVTFEDGTQFKYVNDFDGDWAMDPQKPFGPGGKAQNWSPRVGTEEWKWGSDIVRGVNLGGWLVTEPFIVPALYEEFIGKGGVDVVDEWTLSQAMGSDLATRMEQHYKTFITEQDFIEIAAAGLNWVRIPLGFWAIETMPGEPFLARTSWTYFLKAIQWARKYGLRIYLDLHALPGSQNGWNHSGKRGSINFMHGAMGIANAQRTLSYLRIIVQFVSQPQYKDVIPLVGIVNEILWSAIQKEPIQSFYYAAYQAIRKSTGTGAGPYIAIHEGFQGPAIWEGFLAGADRVALDQHPYLAFIGDRSPIEQMVNKPCDWAIATNQSSKAFGVTIAGEFSVAINNCGLWLNGIGSGPEGCDVWDNWSAYTPATIAGLRSVMLASMDALQHFFFWTWKIGNSTRLGTSTSPMWHYKLGLQQGWIPKDPREAAGTCNKVLGSSQLFDGNYPASATGGPGAGTLDPVMSASNTFPPATIYPSYTGSQLPTYTPTGTIKTLPGPTFTAAPNDNVGTGWNNPADNEPAYVPVNGCQYPNAWDAENVTLPATTCA